MQNVVYSIIAEDIAFLCLLLMDFYYSRGIVDDQYIEVITYSELQPRSYIPTLSPPTYTHPEQAWAAL